MIKYLKNRKRLKQLKFCNDFHFKIGKYNFIIRELEIGKEDEARDRAKQWIIVCKERGKELPPTSSFLLWQLPKID